MPMKDDGVTGDLFAGRSPGDETPRMLPPGSGAPSDRPLAVRPKAKKKGQGQGKPRIRDMSGQTFLYEGVETSAPEVVPPQTALVAPKKKAAVGKGAKKKRGLAEILGNPAKTEIKKLMRQTGRTEADVRAQLKRFDDLFRAGKTEELKQALEQFQVKAPASSSATDLAKSTNRGRANPIPSRGVITPEVQEEGLAIRKPSAAADVADLAKHGPVNAGPKPGALPEEILAALKRLKAAPTSAPGVETEGRRRSDPAPAPAPAPSPELPPSEPIVPDSSPVPDSRPMPPSDPAPGRPAPTDPLPPPKPKPGKPIPGKPKGRLQGFKNALKSKGGKYGLAGLAGLTGGMLLQRLMSNPTQINELEESIIRAERDAKSTKVAQLLKQAREEKALGENKQRLAQSAPDLYSAVMAGQRLPKGSVVLGGRPREDLMRQLAASMDSGRYRQQDPLSDLMG